MKPARGDVTGAVADLGVFVPLTAGLVLVNRVDATAVFVAAGLLTIASGAYFRTPFPVQPLKALGAVAIAQGVSPGVIHAAGLEIAAFLLLMSIGQLADRVTRFFSKPVVRALQFGVGVLLVLTSARLALEPPAVFRGTPEAPWPAILAAGSFVVVWWAARTRRYELALGVVIVGVAAVWHVTAPHIGGPALTLPHASLPRAGDFATAFFLLVVPQLPLTFGNAVVAVTDVAHSAFGRRGERVTASRVCVSCGAGNVASALIGGMPMCHGAGGLTAHVRLGAVTLWMNVMLGGAFVALGLLFGRQAPAILGLIPAWALAAFLLYAGARHAWLVADLRGADLAVACAAGGVGALTGQLALTLGAALAYESTKRFARRRKRAVAVP